MNKHYLIFLTTLIICVSFTSICGQIDGANIYVTESGRIRTPQEVAAMKYFYQRQREIEQLASSRFKPSSQFDDLLSGRLNERQMRLMEKLTKPGETEKNLYKPFLKQSKTGFMTLLAADICSMDSIRPNKIADDDEDCLSRTLPGEGYYYSFRRKNYVTGGQADVGFKRNLLYSIGKITQSIFVELGDVPIESLNLQSSGVDYLTQFVPANNLQDMEKQKEQFNAGVKSGEHFYFSSLTPAINRTYGLRSVAYRGKAITRINVDGKKKIDIDLLEGDERSDIIVIFRVIGTDSGGNLKIIWKTLQNNTVPKLEVPVVEVDASRAKKVVKKL